MKILNVVKKVLFILLLLLFIFTIKSFALTGVITDITVNVREKPTTESNRIMFVTEDDVVEVLEKDGDWYKIKFKNTVGYVFSKYIKVDEELLEEKNIEAVEEIESETSTIDNLKLEIKNGINVKYIPNISSLTLETITEDVTIEIIEELDKWSYICYNNTYGWVLTESISEINQKSTDIETEKKDNNVEKIAYIKANFVNLRKEKSTSSEIISRLNINNEIQVLDSSDSKWYKIKYGELIGYVVKEYVADEKQIISENKKETSSRDGENIDRNLETYTVTNNELTIETVNKDEDKITGEDIAEYAKTFVGYKYVYGGSSPSTGFDCSGLVQYVYKHFGYSISRTATTQSKDGVAVSKENLQLGDIVVFKDTSLKDIGHVGIYIGNNQFVHASEPKVGVKISALSDGKYPQRYVTARRIIK